MNGIVNELANENACHSEVTWSGTVLINLMIVGTQDW